MGRLPSRSASKPATRRVARKPAAPATGSASLPDIRFQTEAVEPIVQEAAKSVASKLGTAPEALPDEVMAAIRTASASALNTRTKALIQRDVDAAVKETVLQGVRPLDMLDARVNAASAAIAHVAQDVQVDAVLADTAKLLFKKFKALTQAGFSEAQAFELLLAEVQGRASRSR